MRFISVFCLFAFISSPSFASIQIGSGFNSATSGRLVPALNLGFTSNSFELQMMSTGVSTTAYYHSAYRLSAFKTWKAGEYFVGDIEAGFGAGALYAIRSFQDSTTAEEKKSDYVVGPALFARWVFAAPFFISVDSLYGIIGPSNRHGDIFALNARDNVNFTFGFSL